MSVREPEPLNENSEICRSSCQLQIRSMFLSAVRFLASISFFVPMNQIVAL